MTSKVESRYWVYDRLTGFSAINPRYWVVDRTTNLPVDEFCSQRAADDTADFLNENLTEGER